MISAASLDRSPKPANEPLTPAKLAALRPGQRLWPYLWALLFAFHGLSLATAEVMPTPDFQRVIRPILNRYCLGCHGPTEQRAGLRLDRKPTEWRGGKSGRPLLEPGRAEHSEIIRRVTSSRREEVMPARGARLEPQEVDLLRRWIEGGAPWPDDKAHWAFIKPVAAPLPTVSRPEWPRNGIDRFIQARLDREGQSPSPEADRHTLIRRLSLDLTGLPPSVEEADAFAHDPRPDAYVRVVERLLASSHYGERQARPWLDLARFADTNGHEIDRRRPVWPWRDWVISAFNRNLPFDQFTLAQLAGDLLPGATDEQRVATGFHRQTILNDEGGANPEEFRVAAVMDRVETTATVWLGLTFNCAQCHTHKHDPITQVEYYQFYAYLNQTCDSGVGFEPVLRAAPPEHQARANWLRAEIARCDAEVRRILARSGPNTPPPDGVAKILAKPRDQLMQKERDTLDAWDRISVGPAGRSLLDHRSQCRREEQTLSSNSPPTMVLTELIDPRQTRVLLRGNFHTPGQTVTPSIPAILHPWPVNAPANRLGLARWLMDTNNPLVARVTVNRVWDQYFGRGLVATPEDFGSQGEPPSHPELLDWLAVEFMRSGWDLKALHRLIVSSATYRQSSSATPELLSGDPLNILLARGPRHRLEAEQVYDLALAVSGRLTRRIGGPSVFPPQPPGIWERSFAYEFEDADRWKEDDGPNRYRRSIYTFIRRTAAHPTAMTFDMDNRTVCRVRRMRTNTPLQALTTLNDQLFLETAAGLAGRMMDHEGDQLERLTFGFRCCITRRPEPAELAHLASLLTDTRNAFRQNEAASAALVLQARGLAKHTSVESAAWLMVANALLNLDETLTKN